MGNGKYFGRYPVEEWTLDKMLEIISSRFSERLVGSFVENTYLSMNISIRPLHGMEAFLLVKKTRRELILGN